MATHNGGLHLYLKNVKAASHGMNVSTGEVAIATLEDERGKFVASGGFEAMVRRGSALGTVENETEARWLASRLEGCR